MLERGPQGEGQPVNPIQEARNAFNRELLGREYHQGALLPVVLQLQSALLRGSKTDITLTPERIYGELATVAGQGAERAQLFDDASTAETLQTLQEGFQLTNETFSTKLTGSKAVRAAQPQPTNTSDLPPMTSVKGGAAPQTQSKPAAQQIATEAPVATEAQQATSETTSQQPPRRRGRPSRASQP